ATVSFSAAAQVRGVLIVTVSNNSARPSSTFADNTAANGKPVTVLGVTLSGTDAGNYTVSQPSGLTANITPRPITVKATSISRVRSEERRVGTECFGGGARVGVMSVDAVSM